MTNQSSFKGTFVRQLAKILKETDLNEIEYEIKGNRIRIVRNDPQQQIINENQINTIPLKVLDKDNKNHIQEKEKSNNNFTVNSPMVGTVYHSPSPDADPFIKVGSKIEKGQTLLIIEAMKVMNPIQSPKTGTISEILVKNSDPVEFEQPLLIIE